MKYSIAIYDKNLQENQVTHIEDIMNIEIDSDMHLLELAQFIRANSDDDVIAFVVTIQP